MSAAADPSERGGAPRPSAERGEMLMEVSNAVVRIHKHFYGKGPTRARAHLSQDLLAVVLEGGFTRGEETLQERGHESEVLRSRILMQHSVETEFRAAIEQIVGRGVRSFMSANDPAAGMQAELFVLEPQPAGQPAEEPPVGEVEAEAEQSPAEPVSEPAEAETPAEPAAEPSDAEAEAPEEPELAGSS